MPRKRHSRARRSCASWWTWCVRSSVSCSFGMDVIVEKGTGRLCIIDVNNFPGYDGVANFLDKLSALLAELVSSEPPDSGIDTSDSSDERKPQMCRTPKKLHLRPPHPGEAPVTACTGRLHGAPPPNGRGISACKKWARGTLAAAGRSYSDVNVGTDQCQCFGYAPARQYYPSSCKPALACVWSTLCWGWKVLVPTCEGLFVSQCDIGTDQCMSVFWSCGGLPRLSDQWQTSVGMCSVNVLSRHQILAAMCNGLFVSQLQRWYGPMPVLRLRSGSPHYLTSGKAALSCVQMTLCWGAAHLLQHGKAR
uniref:Putative inositol-tetrakisphosphate 1-kinase n=1 Tax=Ixodes ricinus TaxID=34613 RepID=A0A090XAS2_IXORI